MKIHRSTSAMLVAAGVALAAFGMTAAAQAQDVYWSVGLSSPGVQMGVSNAAPVLVQPAYRPVYQPVYQADYQADYQTDYQTVYPSAYPPVYPPAHRRVYQSRYPVLVAPRPYVYGPPVPVLLAPPRYVRADWRYPGYRQGWQNQRHEVARAGHDRR